MRKLFLLLLSLLPLVVAGREVVASSPNGGLVVTVSDKGGKATYSVTLNGMVMVQPSLLGFVADFGNFTEGLSIVDSKESQTKGRYQMRQVKQSDIRFTATSLIVGLKNRKQQSVQVEFVVKDNDVAFRYLIPRQKDDQPKTAVIEREVTSFSLPDGTTTFLCPQIGPMTGWERTKPSYEEEYEADAPMTGKSRFGQGYTFPCLFRLGEAWVLISETGVSSLYCGSHLSDYQPPLLSDGNGERLGSYQIAYPQAGENNGFGSATASIPLPGKTPWRTITVGTSLKPIVETTIPYDVVEPLYAPTEEYKGGRYTWSWLIWQDNSINYDDQLKFVDLAADMGYEYCLVDNWWDQNIGRDRIAELSRYARSKGVSLLLWYNSNGHWNDAPQTPRNCMDTPMARDREMAWMKSIGVKGIKVDFFAGDKQTTMQLYEDILFDANRYGLQVVFHGCTIPRGWERMYPNYVSSEAVLASENVFFSEHHAVQEPFELTMHPFCRNAVGTMDWGGVIMNKFLSKDNKSRHARRTTDVFEIATAFTNQTAVQCIAVQPNNLQELPDLELDFLKRIPTTWDETRFIDGYPGRYVVLARRHGSQWYVAALNGMKESLKLSLDLSEYGVKNMLTDVADKKTKTVVVAQKPLKTDKKGRVNVELMPAGGIVMF
jgi:hypothetical protein